MEQHTAFTPNNKPKVVSGSPAKQSLSGANINAVEQDFTGTTPSQRQIHEHGPLPIEDINPDTNKENIVGSDVDDQNRAISTTTDVSPSYKCDISNSSTVAQILLSADSDVSPITTNAPTAPEEPTAAWELAAAHPIFCADPQDPGDGLGAENQWAFMLAAIEPRPDTNTTQWITKRVVDSRACSAAPGQRTEAELW